MNRVHQQSLLEEIRPASNGARGVDVGRVPAVGTAQQGTALFNGSKGPELKVLHWSRRRAVPGVVGDVDQDFRPVPDKVSRQLGENPLEADQRRKPDSGNLTEDIFPPRMEPAHLLNRGVANASHSAIGTYSPKGTR